MNNNYYKRDSYLLYNKKISPINTFIDSETLYEKIKKEKHDNYNKEHGWKELAVLFLFVTIYWWGS